MQIGRTGALAQLFQKVVQSVQRAVEHVGAGALLHHLTVFEQRDLGLRQQGVQGLCIGGQLLDGQALAHQQTGMQAAVGHGVGGGEFPVQAVRLHDFKTRCQPINGFKQLLHAGIGRWRGLHAEDDFRLQPRLAGVGQVNAALGMSGLRRLAKAQARVPDRAPHRTKHLVALPQGAVGEADFVALGRFTTLHAQAAHGQSLLVSRGRVGAAHHAGRLVPQTGLVVVLQKLFGGHVPSPVQVDVKALQKRSQTATKRPSSRVSISPSDCNSARCMPMVWRSAQGTKGTS